MTSFIVYWLIPGQRLSFHLKVSHEKIVMESEKNDDYLNMHLKPAYASKWLYKHELITQSLGVLVLLSWKMNIQIDLLDDYDD